MVYDVVKYLSQQFAYRLPIYNDCIVLAHKDENGKVILKKDTDFIYAGITDDLGNYFYLRYLDGDGSEYSNVGKFFGSSLSTTEVNTTVRLVSVLSDPSQCGQIDKHKVEEDIRLNLKKVNFFGFTGREHNIRVDLLRSGADPVRIMKEETGGKAKGFRNDFIINTMDFSVRFYDVQGGGINVGSCLTGAGVGSGGETIDCEDTEYPFLVASDTWTINHNKGCKPIVNVIGLDDRLVDTPNVHYITNDTVVLSFDEVFAGTALLKFT